MKKLLAGVVILSLFAACGNKKNKVDPFASLTQEVDSMRGKAEIEHPENQPEEPRPTPADGSFDEFIYNFTSNDTLQRQRIRFPLSFYHLDKKTTIGKEAWKHDALFRQQAYYTSLFDREEDLEMMNDTSLSSVQVEWFHLSKSTMKKYYFERIRGVWMLEAINQSPTNNDEQYGFVNFFGRFATDSVFQHSHIQDPLEFVTTDPDDDYTILESSLDLNQWSAFKPELPSENLFNINYGQRNSNRSSTKLLVIKGIDIGFYTVLYFRRKNDKEWELYRFEDTST